jgi:hypothetical protein
MTDDEPVNTARVRADVYADLGGLYEVAEALGVKMPRLKRWIERRESTNCPRPVRVLRSGHIYSIREWTAWYLLWRLTRGRASWERRTTIV